MKIIPRPYQEKAIKDLRISLRTHRTAMFSSPTGSGKSFIFSSITNSAFSKGAIIWVIVPLSELIIQTQRHFVKWKIVHSLIASGIKESRAFNVHIVSKQTIERRWDKIKRWPTLILIDEAHINYDFQIKLLSVIPEYTKIIGLSATPERLDGRGLSDIYDDLIFGPSRKDLVEQGYLSNIRYFAPPLEGLEELHKKGIDVDADELEALFKRRAIYGDVLKHWKEYTFRKPTLAFCRNVDQAERWAHVFREAGFRFECLEGRMKKGRREAIVNALQNNEIHGITSVNLIAMGFDCPHVECILKLRPTESKSLNDQMDGRGMRPAMGKEDCVIFDFVNNIHKHGHPLSPYDWNFYGKEKKSQKNKHADILKLCPKCWQYFTGTVCDNCGNQKQRKPVNIKEIDGRLVEQKGPVPLDELPWEMKKDYQDRISAAREAYREAAEEGRVDFGPIRELIIIAEKLGRSIMWVYYELNELNHAVNVPLLSAIAEIKGYAQGWIYYKRKELAKKNVKKEDKQEVMF
jgi:DNA repair protein RadD